MKLTNVFIDVDGNLSVFDGEGTEKRDLGGHVLGSKVIGNLKKYCDEKTNFHFTLGGNYAMQMPLAIMAADLGKDSIGKSRDSNAVIKTAA